MAETHHQKLLTRVRENFEQSTAEHQLTVLMDQSTDTKNPAPYRHLRIAKPGTRMYSWDIVTWPGHLATSGDIADGYTFSRIYDMADFFRPQSEPYRINPGYWAEKLASEQRNSVKSFSSDALLEAITCDITEAHDYGALVDWEPDWVECLTQDALQAAKDASMSGNSDTEADAAYSMLTSWEYTGHALAIDLTLRTGAKQQDFVSQVLPKAKAVTPFSFNRNGDAYELMSSAQEYNYHLLLAMHAIVRGLELYRDHQG